MTTKRRFPPAALTGLALVSAVALFLARPASAEDDAGVRQTVARVAYVSGNVAFSRGDDPDHWQDVLINVPLTLGDRLWTEKGARVELQVAGARLFVAPETQLSILDLRDDVAQLSLSVGTAALRLRHLEEGETIELDTPNAAVTIRAPGLYRIHVDEDGDTRIDVSEGSAVAAVGPDVAEMHGGDALRVRGMDSPSYQLEALGAPDSWDRWVDERTRSGRSVVSVRYVGGGIAGIDELDSQGRWERIPEYGWAWTPRIVVAGWAPYRDGRWVWQDPWGWTWVSRESWGWAPYHYGSWAFASGRWYWVPEGPAVRTVRYAPARVVFVGAGPGGAVVQAGSVSYVGWFPVHPRDRFVPWWGAPAAVSVTNVTYVNRTYVTVVARDTFVGGGYVRESHVRDARVLREVSAAPVYRGPIPLVPTVASVRFASPALHHELPRPPEKFLDRHVTTSLPPPPRPPTFNTKLDVIRESHGRPYQRPEVERMVPEKTHETRANTVAPRPEMHDTPRTRTDAHPATSSTGPKATPAPGPKTLDQSRPHRPEELPETRHLDKSPTRPPASAAKVPTPVVKMPTPVPKSHAAVEPHPKVQNAPPVKTPPPPSGAIQTHQGPPEKSHAQTDAASKMQKTPVVEKPKTSTAPKNPPEKKRTPEKPVS